MSIIWWHTMQVRAATEWDANLMWMLIIAEYTPIIWSTGAPSPVSIVSCIPAISYYIYSFKFIHSIGNWFPFFLSFFLPFFLSLFFFTFSLLSKWWELSFAGNVWTPELSVTWDALYKIIDVEVCQIQLNKKYIIAFGKS